MPELLWLAMALAFVVGSAVGFAVSQLLYRRQDQRWIALIRQQNVAIDQQNAAIDQLAGTLKIVEDQRDEFLADLQKANDTVVQYATMLRERSA